MMGIYWHLKRQWQGISLIASLHWSALPATNFMQFEPIFPIALESYSYAWLWRKRLHPGIDFICCRIICINNQICNINWLAPALLGGRRAAITPLILHPQSHCDTRNGVMGLGEWQWVKVIKLRIQQHVKLCNPMWRLKNTYAPFCRNCDLSLDSVVRIRVLWAP